MNITLSDENDKSKKFRDIFRYVLNKIIELVNAWKIAIFKEEYINARKNYRENNSRNC
jgi:hypothetical protein